MNIVASKPLRPRTYIGIKNKFNGDTFRTGLMLSSYYGISQDTKLFASVVLGSSACFLYSNMLSKYVDRIEEKPIPYHLTIPITMVLAESIWNHNVDDFQLDYITSFIGFFSYKLAIFNMMVDAIRYDINEMLEKEKEK